MKGFAWPGIVGTADGRPGRNGRQMREAGDLFLRPFDKLRANGFEFANTAPFVPGQGSIRQANLFYPSGLFPHPFW